MNWIDFSKERPKEEPKRKILVYFQADGAFITDTFDANLTHNATHWAEIEPPDLDPHPCPVDPFEVWWRNEPVRCLEVEGFKERQRKAWDAAIRWKEGK